MKRKTNKRKPANRKHDPIHGPAVDNDNLTKLWGNLDADKLVPKWAKGTDQFLDIICWNIRFFNHRDDERVKNIADVLGQLNADLFVFEEIEEGSLDPVAELLRKSGAGLYATAYGTTGGRQRVAMMIDTEWVRNKEEIVELFADEPPFIAGSRKRVFPRLPLHSTFVGMAQADKDGKRVDFDFHLAGVHLKSQRANEEGDDGTEQRTASAARLARWIERELGDDHDAIILGDWNKEPGAEEWDSLRQLEGQQKIRFEGWNDGNEASHFYKNGHGSLLDLVVVTADAAAAAAQKGAKVVHWTDFLTNSSVRQELIEKLSDHHPVYSRFYFGKAV